MEFKLPEIGEGVTEGEIVTWLVAVGDSVEKDQPFVEVMTDKATVTIDAPESGTVASLVVAEGDTINIGDVMAIIEGSGASEASAPSPSEDATTQDSGSEQEDSGSEGGIVEFSLPEIGEGVTEGEVVSWLVAVGDSVSEEQPIVEIMTDKATVTVDSPVNGTIEEFLAEEGATVAIGSTLCHIRDKSAKSKPKSSSSTGTVSAPSKQTSNARKGTAPSLAPHERARILAAPRTRKVARELGIDISQVSGTGKNGRITTADVENYAKGGAAQTAPAQAKAPTSPAPAKKAPKAPSPAAPVKSGENDKRVKITGVRKKISEAMSRSKRTAAHFSYVEEVDITELFALRQELKPIAAEQDAKLTYMPFIIKATVATLKQFPNFNSNIDDSADELIVRGDINLGIAADTEYGLVVPVLKNADRLSMIEIAKEVRRLGTGARDRKLQLDEMRGGTFTITNAGAIGGLFATPIINYPEVAILGVHKIKERPIVKNGEITIGQIMYLSLSLDHRIIDGADAARFMKLLVSYLENPKLLMLA